MTYVYFLLFKAGYLRVEQLENAEPIIPKYLCLGWRLHRNKLFLQSFTCKQKALINFKFQTFKFHRSVRVLMIHFTGNFHFFILNSKTYWDLCDKSGLRSPRFSENLQLCRGNSRRGCQQYQFFFFSFQMDIFPVPERNIKISFQCPCLQVFKMNSLKISLSHSLLLQLLFARCLHYDRVRPHTMTLCEIIIDIFYFRK